VTVRHKAYKNLQGDFGRRENMRGKKAFYSPDLRPQE
jgi:hypothetical protein